MTASEPDPTVMPRLCREVVPSMLTEACGVDAAQATAIGEYVLAPALSFAALGDPDRDVRAVDRTNLTALLNQQATEQSTHGREIGVVDLNVSYLRTNGSNPTGERAPDLLADRPMP